MLSWAHTREEIRALLVVGSHARGEARPDSDVDLVLLCTDAAAFLRDTEWTLRFGEVASVARENWGELQSLRVLYRDGPEVEFGIAALGWARVPPDAGSVRVVRDGCRILLDRDGMLERLLRSAHEDRG